METICGKQEETDDFEVEICSVQNESYKRDGKRVYTTDVIVEE